jgi:hypothetical protein
MMELMDPFRTYNKSNMGVGFSDYSDRRFASDGLFFMIGSGI